MDRRKEGKGGKKGAGSRPGAVGKTGPKPRVISEKARDMVAEMKLDRLKEIKAQKIEILRAKQDYINSNLIEFFGGAQGLLRPNPPQAKLLAAWEDEHYKIFTYTGGNRSGKTTIGAIIAISTIMGEWPWSKKRLAFPHNLPRKVRYIGQDWEKHISQVVIPALKKWWPKGRALKVKKNSLGIDALWTDEKTGGTIEIMSNKQDSDLHEGWDGDMICVEENQRVLVADGRYVPIKDLKQGDVVWTVANNGIRCLEKISRVINNGVRDTVKVTLVGGTELCCTPDHEIYTRYGKKRADELTLNDKVYCPCVDIEGQRADGYFFALGAWIGDGWCDKKRVFYASASDEFLSYLSSVLPYNQKLVHRKRYDYEVQPSNKELFHYIDKFGLTQKKAHEKYIPDDIFKLDKDGKIEFLQGLYATDGWFIDGGIGYGTTSKRLAYDLHKLLRSLRIHGTIQYKKSQLPGKWREQWFLMVCKSASVLRFIEMLKFVPGKDMVGAKKKAIGRYKNKAGLFKGNPSENNMACDKAYNRSIQYFAVKSVVPNGKARVYDLTIENNHNFICEGMKISNCYDEPPKRDIRVANARGLVDRQGRELFCMTLLKEAWVDREVIKARNPDGTPDTSVFNVHSDSYANVGYGITQEGLEQFKKTLTLDEIEARLNGVPSYMSGLVCPKFKREVHIRPRVKDIPLDWIVDIGIDFHPSKPWAILFMGTDRHNFKYIIDEMWEKGSWKAIGEEMLRRIKRQNLRVGRIIIDPLSKGDTTSDLNEDSVFTKLDRMLNAHGLVLHTATKDKDGGIIMLNDLLMTENEMPALFFSNHLKRSIYEIEGWMYDDNGKPAKVDDDMMENLYRLVLLNTQYEEPGDEDEGDYRSSGPSTANTWTGY